MYDISKVIGIVLDALDEERDMMAHCRKIRRQKVFRRMCPSGFPLWMEIRLMAWVYHARNLIGCGTKLQISAVFLTLTRSG